MHGYEENVLTQIKHKKKEDISQKTPKRLQCARGKGKKFCLMFKRFANCQDPPHNQRETTKQPYNQQPKKKKSHSPIR